ncbi:MAG: murein L,D-transpeptidase family protein [Alphaproteobacteria bacterium]
MFALGLASFAVAGVGVWREWGTRHSWLDLMRQPLALLDADRVVVLKGRRELLLYDGGVVVGRYAIALGFDPQGHKWREGDGRTPEGLYALDWRRVSDKLGPAIHVSYPNENDKARAAKAGVDPGGGIMLHALGDALPWQGAAAQERRWTEGCIGLRRRDMRELWHAVADGTPIDIRP